MPLAVGATFAGYTIVRLLGSGAMGEVYLARHPRLPREDALKVLRAEVSADPDYRERFIREAELAAKLWHPNIVAVHDRGEHRGQLWITMDYVAGTDALDQLKCHPDGMPTAEVVSIVGAVARALDYAHGKGLLHRDVKPANILLTQPDDEDERRILLSDFGIARSVGEISGLTATNMTVGTVAYSAPEQLMGEHLDGRADQYALAATAYHLLTGRHLFPHSNPAVVIGKHLNASPPPIAATHPQLAALQPALATALSKSPDDRFPRCVDFARALASAHSQASLSPTTLPATQPAPLAHRPSPDLSSTHPSHRPPPTAVLGRLPRWSVTVGVIVAVLLLICGVGLVLRPWQHNHNNPATAPESAAPAMTFDGMRDFVRSYYADLPANPNLAWAKLDTHCQQQTGLGPYLDFWATIQSVSVMAVSPRDASSVIARLRYIRRNGQSDTEDRWFKFVLVDGAMQLDDSDRVGSVPTGEPTPSATTSISQVAAGPFPASSIDHLLLAPQTIGRVTGAGPWRVDESTSAPTDHSALVTPFSCSGVIFTAEQSVYANSGFVALRSQTLKATPPTVYPGMPLPPDRPEQVQQTVVAFPTPEQAQALLTRVQGQWQSCAADKVSYRVPGTNGEVGWGYDFGKVQLRGDVLTVSMAGINRESGNSACEQVLGVRANVVVGVRSCLDPSQIPTDATVADPNLAGTYAETLASEVLVGVKW